MIEPSPEEPEEQFGYYPVKHSDADLTRWQLTAEDLLTELEHDLKGEEYDHKTRSWVLRSGGQPLMNQKGVRAVVSMVKPVVNKNTFLSNLSEKRINEYFRKK